MVNHKLQIVLYSTTTTTTTIFISTTFEYTYSTLIEKHKYKHNYSGWKPEITIKS